jgi:hypothetical protein
LTIDSSPLPTNLNWNVALRIVLLLAAGVGVRSNANASDAGVFDFRGAQFKILSADGKQTIGTTRFTTSRGNSIEEIKGETVYLDGEHDSEDEHLRVAGDHTALKLDSYVHTFFNSDGSILMVDTLDTRSGIASCMKYTSGSVKVRKSRLDVPADSFAGASGLMTIVGRLRQGIREIRFHEFACAPGPAIFSVEASLRDRSERWPLYPGSLARLDMRPDLGALNFLIAPLLPRIDAWFNPNDDWNYVGGEFDRYFRGPHVLTVRITPAD